MVETVKVSCLFDGGDVGRLLNYADLFLIAGGTAAVDAGIDVRNIVAGGAEAQLGLYILDGGGEGLGVVGTRTKNMKRQALGGFAAYSWKLLEFVDQPRHWLSETRHFG